MSQFNSFLISRGLPKHDGQSLWKYNLTDLEFHQLRKVLMESRNLTDLDSRDCTLYYAEWWKRCYNGGFPSKEDVFSSISNGQVYDADQLYTQARKGAHLLGIPWIKHQNTLYFKTLLLQGGLPIKHISSNKGAYKNFLLRILEVNPTSIDDFAFDTSITSLLPGSARNDEIYECCLSIVKAFDNNEDGSYLTLLDNNQDLNDISGELRIKRQSLKTTRRLGKFKAAWVLEPDKTCIRLYLAIPEMSSNDFNTIFLQETIDADFDFEYKMFYNDKIICKMIRRANGHYRTDWLKNDLTWDKDSGYPELYVSSTAGKKYSCQHLITHLPRLDRPTLWIQYSEAQWIMERGSHTNQEEAFILYPDGYKSILDKDAQILEVCGDLFNWVNFKQEIILSDDNTQYSFKTNSKKIDWHFLEKKPKWMQRTNGCVVRGNPNVLVYDENGEYIKNKHLQWRQKPNLNWNEWSIPVPLGWIELQIQALNSTEYEDFFNIGSLEANITSNSLHEAEVELINNPFLFRISASDVMNIDKIDNNKVSLRLVNSGCIPTSIQASIKASGQNKSLTYELTPPFKGVEIIDNGQIIIPNGGTFHFDSLSGYRLMSNQNNLVISFFNTSRPKILVSEVLTEKFIPLRSFEDKILQLFTLSDSMDGNAEIVIEIAEQQGKNLKKIKSYSVHRYTQKIDFEFDIHRQVSIRTGPLNVEMYAVPIECSNEQLELRELMFDGSKYLFKNTDGLDKFIVFSTKENDVKVQPAFVSLNLENVSTTYDDRIKRIVKLKDELLSSGHTDDIWKRFFSYYNICCNNEIPFSTFDILRAIGYSSELAAKSFLYLTCFDPAQNFAEDIAASVENDLGFSYHWINKHHWVQAIEWIDSTSDQSLHVLLFTAIKSHFDTLQPNAHFSKISNYILQDINPKSDPNYHLNSRINKLRGSLGIKVLTELPQKCPKIPEAYENIISVTDESTPIRVLLQSPLSVALSIAGKDESLWSSDYEYIRRNVKYSQQLDPDWYAEAINYTLTKI